MSHPTLNPQDADEVAMEVLPQVPLQIAPQANLRTTMQIGQEVGLAIAARI